MQAESSYASFFGISPHRYFLTALFVSFLIQDFFPLKFRFAWQLRNHFTQSESIKRFEWINYQRGVFNHWIAKAPCGYVTDFFSP
jgi:hypothetical protein